MTNRAKKVIQLLEETKSRVINEEHMRLYLCVVRSIRDAEMVDNDRDLGLCTWLNVEHKLELDRLNK